MKSKRRIACVFFGLAVIVCCPVDAQELARVVSIHSEHLPVDLASPCCDKPEGICYECDLVNDCWFATFEYLNLRPRGRGLDYAVLDDGTFNTVGRGSVRRMEYSDDSGFRAGFGYRTRTGWGISARYTGIDFSGRGQTLHPGGTAQLFPTRTHPDSPEDADLANAFGGLDFDYVDLEASRSFFSNRFSDLRCFGGVRWADVGQRLLFEYDGRSLQGARVEERQDVQAFGLRLGADGHWRLARGFSLIGSTSGSLLHGRFNTRVMETHDNGVDPRVDVTDNYNDMLSTLELSGGVAWQNPWLEIATGYEMNGWFNINNRGLFVDSETEGIYSPMSTDLLLHGLFVRLTVSH